jgi:hypothetical protein
MTEAAGAALGIDADSLPDLGDLGNLGGLGDLLG